MVKRAFYDFSVSPFSYDFLAFIVQARAHGFTETVFVPGVRSYQKCTPEQQAFRLEHLLVPLALMSGTCKVAANREEAAALAEGCEVFPFGYTVEKPVHAHLFGQAIKGGVGRWLTPSRDAQELAGAFLKTKTGVRTPITITIRESLIKPARNSNLAEWMKAAAALHQDVLFIPDTDNLERNFSPFDSYPEAALDPDLRLALYSRAKLNLGIGNGPMGLCFYSTLPYMLFRMLDENSGYPETSAAFLKANSLPVGSQAPWRSSNQAIVWEPDTAEVIVRHVKQWTNLRKAA